MSISLVLAQKMSWPWPVLCHDLGVVLWHAWVVPRLFLSRFELEHWKFGLVVSVICMGPRRKHVDTAQPPHLLSQGLASLASVGLRHYSWKTLPPNSS